MPADATTPALVESVQTLELDLHTTPAQHVTSNNKLPCSCQVVFKSSDIGVTHVHVHCRQIEKNSLMRETSMKFFCQQYCS